MFSVARPCRAVRCRLPMTNFCLRLATRRGMSEAGVTVKLLPIKQSQCDENERRNDDLTENETHVGFLAVVEAFLQFILGQIFAEVNERISQLTATARLAAPTAGVVVVVVHVRIVISQILGVTLLARFEIHVAVQLSEMIGVYAAPKVKAIAVLRDDALQNSASLQFDQCPTENSSFAPIDASTGSTHICEGEGMAF